MNFIKKLVPLNIKVGIMKRYDDYLLNSYYKQSNNKKRFFIIGSPHHGNLGDQAITSAEFTFLIDNFNDYEILEIRINEYYRHVDLIRNNIKNSDIIFIHGGGNFGNQYLFDENIRRDIIKQFPQNKIIQFPQTIYFTEDDEGNNELEKSKDIYNKHERLTLIAREKKSYQVMKNHFKNNNILLTPDIVLFLEKSDGIRDRRGALLCLRNDIEGILLEDEKNKIIDTLHNSFSAVNITDTVIKDIVSRQNREEYLNEKFNEFKNSEIVVTDRLHGMIFAAITGTPCIVLSNYNYKVIGTYDWIKKLEYIKFANNIDEIPAYIEELKYIKKYKYDNDIVKKQYDKIIQIIKER